MRCHQAPRNPVGFSRTNYRHHSRRRLRNIGYADVPLGQTYSRGILRNLLRCAPWIPSNDRTDDHRALHRHGDPPRKRGQSFPWVGRSNGPWNCKEPKAKHSARSFRYRPHSQRCSLHWPSWGWHSWMWVLLLDPARWMRKSDPQSLVV